MPFVPELFVDIEYVQNAFSYSHPFSRAQTSSLRSVPSSRLVRRRYSIEGNLIPPAKSKSISPEECADRVRKVAMDDHSTCARFFSPWSIAPYQLVRSRTTTTRSLPLAHSVRRKHSHLQLTRSSLRTKHRQRSQNGIPNRPERQSAKAIFRMLAFRYARVRSPSSLSPFLPAFWETRSLIRHSLVPPAALALALALAFALAAPPKT